MGREEGIEYARHLWRKTSRRETHQLIVVGFPTDRDHRLAVRLERTTEFDLEYAVQVRDIDVWKTPRWHTETVNTVMDSSPVVGAFYVPFVAIDLLEDALYGPKYYEEVREPVPGSNRTEFEVHRSTEKSPVADQVLVLQNIGKAKTDGQGLASFRVRPASFKTPVRIEWEGHDLAYELAIIDRICRTPERSQLLKTGNLILGVLTKAQLVWRLLSGKITPVSFVIGLVIDVATGIAIDYVIERLETRCTDCGYKWEVQRVRGPTLDLQCPACGRRGRLHVHFETLND